MKGHLATINFFSLTIFFFLSDNLPLPSLMSLFFHLEQQAVKEKNRRLSLESVFKIKP